jgi:FkbM family methyltransferase
MVSFFLRLLILLAKFKRRLIYLFSPNLKVEKTFPVEIKKILNGEIFRAVDVGGAVDLQPHWYKLVEAAHFFIFEPHPESFEAIKQKYQKYSASGLFHILPDALSGSGGPRTLFMTNTPTGSTIVTLNKESKYLRPDNGYIFPMKEMPLQTKTLAESLKNAPVDIVKLDIQGAELEVLNGLGRASLSNLLCFEMEVHLQDAYVNGTKFQDVLKFAEANEYELFDVRVARASLQRNGLKSHLGDGLHLDWEPSVASKSWELDVVFFKKPDLLLEEQNKSAIRKLIVCYCVYNFFLEATGLAEEARSKGLLSNDECLEIRESCLKMKRSMDINLKPYKTFVKAQNNQHWGQYMWVSYPTT